MDGIVNNQRQISHLEHLFGNAGTDAREPVHLVSVGFTASPNVLINLDAPVTLLSAPTAGQVTLNGADGDNWQQISPTQLSADFSPNPQPGDSLAIVVGDSWVIPRIVPIVKLVES